MKTKKTLFISILKKKVESEREFSGSSESLKKKRSTDNGKTIFKPKQKFGMKQFDKSKNKNQGITTKGNINIKDQKKFTDKDKIKKNIVVKGVYSKYKKYYKKEKESDTDKHSFSNKSDAESESDINVRENIQKLYKSLVKSLTKTINQVIKKRKREAFYAFRETILNQKTEKEIEEERIYYEHKLYKTLRKITIKKLFIEKEEILRAKKLLHLIKITSINSQISTDRWIRNIIRRWRFISFVKNVSKKKLELMYKNLHIGYLEIINSLFNNESKYPSMIKEFENFGADIGMYKNDEGYLDREKELYQKIKKKYISKPIEYDRENSLKIESGKFINDLKYKSDEDQDVDYIYMDSDKSILNRKKGVRRSLNYDRDK